MGGLCASGHIIQSEPVNYRSAVEDARGQCCVTSAWKCHPNGAQRKNWVGK